MLLQLSLATMMVQRLWESRWVTIWPIRVDWDFLKVIYNREHTVCDTHTGYPACQAYRGSVPLLIQTNLSINPITGCHSIKWTLIHHTMVVEDVLVPLCFIRKKHRIICKERQTEFSLYLIRNKTLNSQMKFSETLKLLEGRFKKIFVYVFCVASCLYSIKLFSRLYLA